jgi:transposase InsO family protein
MDFIMGLPLSARMFDSNRVIVDRFTKSAHFILVHTNYWAKKYAELYIARILCLHGVPKTIISDWDPQFIALHASLGMHLICSSAYHPQTDGQMERVNQILKNMLWACVLNYHDK